MVNIAPIKMVMGGWFIIAIPALLGYLCGNLLINVGKYSRHGAYGTWWIGVKRGFHKWYHNDWLVCDEQLWTTALKWMIWGYFRKSVQMDVTSDVSGYGILVCYPVCSMVLEHLPTFTTKMTQMLLNIPPNNSIYLATEMVSPPAIHSLYRVYYSGVDITVC